VVVVVAAGVLHCVARAGAIVAGAVGTTAHHFDHPQAPAAHEAPAEGGGQDQEGNVQEMNSAAVNSQPMIRAKMMPSSITKFLLAISKAMAEVKFAPLRNSDRARATAA
jgi:hypothetical protein